MALEALRDVFIQAGQDYAKRVRQDELLAQERARQDELYTRQRGDTEKDMNRRRDEQIASEKRADAFKIASEDREITNAVKRVNALGVAEASNVMRRAVYMSGRPEALDPSKMDEATVAALFPEALKGKAVQDATNAQSAETEAKLSNLKKVQEYTDAQRAPAIASEKSRYSKIESDLAAVTSKIEARSKSSGGDAKRIGEMYSNAVTQEANRITGGDRLDYVKRNFPKAKGDVPDIDILMNSSSYPLFLERMKIQVAAEKDKDPEIVSLLTDQQNLFASRKQNQEALAALNVDFSTLTPGAGAGAKAPAVTPVGGTQPATLKDGVVPSPAALNDAMGIGGTPPSANPRSPSVGVPANERDAGGGDDTGNFFVKGTSVAPSAPAPAAAPAPVAAPANATPAWWSTERDNDKNRQAVLDAFASVPGRVAGAAGSVFDAAQTGASYLNPNNYVSGRTAPAYSKAPPPPEGMNATVVYDPQAAANNRRFNDERPATPTEFFTTGNATSKINTALPDVATSGGPLSASVFFSSAQDPTLAYQLPMNGSPKPKNFGESFAQRYNDVKNSHMSPNDKAKSLEALVQTRDMLVSRGLTYDSPDPAPEFNGNTSNVGGTVYTGPMSKAPGRTQGGAAVSPQTFPAYFTPKR